MIALRIQLVGVLGAVNRMRNAFDAAARRAMYAIARMVAGEAKENHAFRNRTFRLERSLRAERPTGRLSANTLSVEVTGNTYYAGFVEEKVTYRSWAYLRPAWTKVRGAAQRELSDALGSAAARGSGL